MKRIKQRISLILILSILLSAVPVCPVMAAGDSLDDIVIPYASLCQGYKDAEYKSSISYKDAYFSASSEKYDHEIARLSLALAMSGFGRGKNKPQDKNLKAFLTELKFDMESYVSYNYDDGDKEDSIAHAFCVKEIPAPDGGTETLLVPALRSINYGTEGWVGNFTPGDAEGTGYHEGFLKAAEGVRDDLRDYINERGIDRDKLKIWIAGYSRSAPTAGILSELLSEEPIGVPADRIFTYTFASANYEITDQGKSNAFHLALPDDLITAVPFRSWNFKRSGRTLFLISPQSEGDGKIFERMQEYYRDIMSQAGFTGEKLEYRHFSHEQPLINWLVFSLENAITSPKQYEEGIQGTVQGAIRKDVDPFLKTVMWLAGINIEEVAKKLEAFRDHYESGKEKEVREDIAYFKKKRDTAEGLFKFGGSLAGLDPAFSEALSIVKRVLNGAEKELDLGLIDKPDETPNLLLVDTASHVVAFGEPPFILNKHYYEVYLAYLLATDEKDLTDAEGFAAKTVMIKGDTLVSVSDNAGNILVSVSGGRVYSSSGNRMVKAAFIAGDTSVFCFPDTVDVRVSVQPSDPGNGSFNYTLRENHTDMSDALTISSRDVYCKKDEVFVAEISGNEAGRKEPSKPEKTDPVTPDEEEETESEKTVPAVTKRYRYAVDKETLDTVMVKGKQDISAFFPKEALSRKHRFKTPGKKLLTVSKKGIAKGKKPGTYQVSLEKKGTSGYETVSSAEIKVEAPKMVKKAEVSLKDESADATLLLSGTEYLPTEWISTNKKVATIDENGRIIFHKKGKTKIIAVFGRGKLSTKKKIKTTLKIRI